MRDEATLLEQAKNLRWGPTIDEPTSVKEALDYAVRVLGDQSRPATLGEVYSIKMLLWLQTREQAGLIREG